MMLKGLSVFLILCVVVSQSISTPESTHYWAGVVEYNFNGTPADKDGIKITLDKYLSIIESKEAEELDIIVFPESTLNNQEAAVFVPDPLDYVAACNNWNYDKIVRDISCAARDTKKYVLINLTEKSRCPESQDNRPCPSSLLNKFNTNVVFDRNGVVVSKYRKFNLFGEVGINTTLHPEAVAFETDFGVKFGHFICFDIMFDTPAMVLVKRGITDIIYPSMWFSELPFLTAVQTQQNWAYVNNVNLLASGANFPEIGSTGTGIYSGKEGSLVSVMNQSPETKLYVAKVPKINKRMSQNNDTQRATKMGVQSRMDDLFLKRDQLDKYTTELLIDQTNKVNTSLCHHKLCCDFEIEYKISEIKEDEEAYKYRVAVYDGIRTFDGFADGWIVVCGILACTDETLASCGTRFKKGVKIAEVTTFETVKISGKFESGSDRFIMPNSVDTSIMPLDVNEFDYSEGIEFDDDGMTYKNISYSLSVPKSNLLSFAIWGRSFNMPSHGASFDSNISSVLFSLLFAISMKNVVN